MISAFGLLFPVGRYAFHGNFTDSIAFALTGTIEISHRRCHSRLADELHRQAGPAGIHGPDASRTCLPATPGAAARSRHGDCARGPQVGPERDLPFHARMVVPVYTVARDAGRLPSHHCLSV